MAKKKKKPPPRRFNPPQGTDIISKLPVDIIHDILRRLKSPEEAARTSTLSRIWHRRIWRSYPFVKYYPSESDHELLDPNRYWIKPEFQTKFHSFVISTAKRLRIYLPRNTIPLSEFKIRVNNGSRVSELLDELLDSLSSLSKVYGSPLKISIENNDRFTYVLPDSILQNCSRTRVLKLEGCSLEGLSNCSRFFAEEGRNLESLSLVSVQEIERLGSNFHDLKSLEVRELNWGGTVQELQISAAPSLEILDVLNCKLKVLSSSAAPNLRSLEIYGNPAELTNHELHEITSNLPSLESLSIARKQFASGKCCLRISNPPYKLKEFSLSSCLHKPLTELKIDAPNLSRMIYNPDEIVPPFEKVDLVNVASDFHFELDVWCGMVYDIHEWFVGWREFLTKSADQFRNLTVKLRDLKVAVTWQPERSQKLESEEPWSRMTPNLVVVERLILETSMCRDSPCSQQGHILHGCFSICRPKLMSVAVVNIGPIHSEYDVNLPTYFCRKLMSRNAVKCCGDKSTCWRNCLKDVKIKGDNGESIEISEDVISSIFERKQTSVTFMLTW
ncbi:hypothetical protein LINGRAHAP2_LOCUS33748 [Linum grandiflorum]